MDMNAFEQAHQAFIERHLKSRQGERRARLARGHAHGEKMFLQHVWWPLFRNFHSLHPEYEVYDWNRRMYYLDFAIITPFMRIGIECDGFQSHIMDMDRDKFNYSLRRNTFLAATGWKMLHFSIDELRDNPKLCQDLLRIALGSDTLNKNKAPGLLPNPDEAPARTRDSLLEKEVLLLAWKLSRPLRPKDVREALGVCYITARKHLHSLSAKGLLRPISKGKIIRYYELGDASLNDIT